MITFVAGVATGVAAYWALSHRAKVAAAFAAVKKWLDGLHPKY